MNNNLRIMQNKNVVNIHYTEISVDESIAQHCREVIEHAQANNERLTSFASSIMLADVTQYTIMTIRETEMVAVYHSSRFAITSNGKKRRKLGRNANYNCTSVKQ